MDGVLHGGSGWEPWRGCYGPCYWSSEEVNTMPRADWLVGRESVRLSVSLKSELVGRPDAKK